MCCHVVEHLLTYQVTATEYQRGLRSKNLRLDEINILPQNAIKLFKLPYELHDLDV